MNLKSYLRKGKGATDITPLLGNKEAFKELITRLSDLARIQASDKVVCVEGRGFILGAAVAFNLGLGLVPVRTPGKLKNETHSVTFVDYSSKEKTLEIHKDALTPGDKVIIIDDWVETGETVKATIALVEKCGGKVAGITAFMDDSTEELKGDLKKYNYNFLDKVTKGDQF